MCQVSGIYVYDTLISIDYHTINIIRHYSSRPLFGAADEAAPWTSALRRALAVAQDAGVHVRSGQRNTCGLRWSAVSLL